MSRRNVSFDPAMSNAQASKQRQALVKRHGSMVMRGRQLNRSQTMASMMSTMSTSSAFAVKMSAMSIAPPPVSEQIESRFRLIDPRIQKLTGMPKLEVKPKTSIAQRIAGEIKPEDMRSIVLMCADKMRDAMLAFVTQYSDVLSRFKIVTTSSIAEMLSTTLDLSDALELSDLALGADSQAATYMVHEDVGAVIYFVDPLAQNAFDHDTRAFERLINVWNVLYAGNTCSAEGLMEVLQEGVEGKPEVLPSFFFTLESPAVVEYKAQQDAVVSQMKSRATAAAPAAERDASTKEPLKLPASKEEAITVAPPKPVLQSQKKSVILVDSPMIHNEGLARTKRNDFRPKADEMRCLALISHNHMKPAMQDFVKAHSDILKCFRLTGTNSTMAMLRSVLGEGAHFGPACASGPLGGDAQVGSQLVLEGIGGVVFFTDPLSAHPHIDDVYSLVRLVNLANVLHAVNTTSAIAMMRLLDRAINGNSSLIPSFFYTLQCPSLTYYNDVNVTSDSDIDRHLTLHRQKSNYSAESVDERMRRHMVSFAADGLLSGEVESIEEESEPGKTARGSRETGRRSRESRESAQASTAERSEPPSPLLLIGVAAAAATGVMVIGAALVGSFAFAVLSRSR
eukprot:CAMPEP_0119359706 /NCGR_PEP_ID=MMETSP1334-20130426/7523_1 /TAXON_ID=127549 /ORGANISM="Calcidiscus leptoporus, Strain RCC1130" /LENGTH=623 /DNA_ID=CAMNT_0007374425 /DNA_START=15 /DNA_END=1886 /DNA_ORIENTATION=+